ncbi:EAL domain-containing protein [Xanthomonas campestris]|uniref:EAL domain-containing response regulator n=1 Tax=Xanthomonas campestris TaxID=339 RepID=UPI000C28D93A|nr:EAL domain-containing response regulator [Xanthomonas campestris]MCD0252110.1 EAL domain-containing response regulator [Xanthomonas campestris pv. campestris]MCD0264734.1 EAL domain-containing response regulator [Xanthomonas campestris pv. campestris]MCD0272967.1 EAL domain-containing response regulator [Xanthomonas campestris pv. campestris]MCD0274790.1 EAL domain-containing response regulator [Xanthomonas campestris pv. campestris]MCF8788647.1 EAL domain-containing response regulator [Xan
MHSPLLSCNCALAGPVLVVDDSVVQREHAMALCRQLGASVVEGAGDGHAALDWLSRASAPSLLLIDLEMPGMDGVQLLDALARGQHSIPVVVVSQRGGALIDAVMQLSRSAGVRVLAGLEKPLRLQDLATTLDCIPAPLAETPTALSTPISPLLSSGGAAASRLDRAMRRGEIRVAYQPKLDLRDGRLRGVEALARWRRPQGDMIGPDRFIPLAEREGLIHALTQQVIDKAVAQLVDWRAEGLQLTLALNLSPNLLGEQDFLEHLCAKLADNGLAPADLVLELTESAIVEPANALSMLARLRLHGFGLSIDDYGTGFSSLQRLASIPFTELKLDRSFVHAAHRSRSQRTVLESTLELAHRLELTAVAEGVETPEDWRLLRELGCDLAQGYLMASPMPGPVLSDWWREHASRIARLCSSELPTDADLV